jgi:RimJ/RimL family protein N-acetyltransferase
MTPKLTTVLTTERLVLRAPELGDFAPYAAHYASERSVFEDGPLSRAEAWRVFASAVGLWPLRGYGAWSITDGESGAYLGEAGIFHPAHYPEPEIGWTVMADAEGRGIAHEAAVAVRDWAYRTLGWTTLVSYIADGNVRSIRLAERLGAVLEPEAARPEGEHCLVYRHPGPTEIAA